jgi:hypothetical protein
MIRNMISQNAGLFGNNTTAPGLTAAQIAELQRELASKGGQVRYFDVNPNAQSMSYDVTGVPRTANTAANATGLKGLYSKFASNPTLQKAGKFGSGALKAAPYLGLGLMGAQGIGELLEGGSLGRSNEELAGQINLMGQGTPMLSEFMDPNAMKDFENLQRRGDLQKESKLVSGIKGAGSEIPGAALTALLFTLLTGGAGLPLGLAFGAGQLGVGATRGLKNREVEEQSRLQNLYSQLSDSLRMSKASRMPATQNYNMR